MKEKTYTPEEIKERFNALPADIKSLVFSANMLNLIKQLGEKYKLHVDKLDILEAEVADVMTGFSKPEDFVKNLTDSLSINQAQAESIAKDINDGLFLKIRESMKSIYETKRDTAPVAVKITTPTSPPPPAPIAKAIEPHPADLMLAQKTVSVAPAAPVLPIAPKPAAPIPPPTSPTPPATPPVAPKPYTADPYREVPE